MKYKILFCDVDGTLLNSKRELTKETVSAVNLLVKKGVKFVISTGRPLCGVSKISQELGLKEASYVLYNGAMVFADGKEIFSACLTKNTATKIVKEGYERSSTMILWKNNLLYADKPSDKVDFYKSISKIEPVYVEDLIKVCDDKVTKILWYDDKESTPKYLAEMKNLLKDDCSVFTSRKDFLEFVNVNCSKKTAMKIIADYYGISLKNAVAVGDENNDLPMFEEVGLSVAMGNALQSVKSKCDKTTLSCDENGVASLIYEIIEENEK